MDALLGSVLALGAEDLRPRSGLRRAARQGDRASWGILAVRGTHGARRGHGGAILDVGVGLREGPSAHLQSRFRRHPAGRSTRSREPARPCACRWCLGRDDRLDHGGFGRTRTTASNSDDAPPAVYDREPCHDRDRNIELFQQLAGRRTSRRSARLRLPSTRRTPTRAATPTALPATRRSSPSGWA